MARAGDGGLGRIQVRGRPYLRAQYPHAPADGAKSFRTCVIPRNNLRATYSHASSGWPVLVWSALGGGLERIQVRGRPYLRAQYPHALADGAKSFRTPVIPRNNLRATYSHASLGWPLVVWSALGGWFGAHTGSGRPYLRAQYPHALADGAKSFGTPGIRRNNLRRTYSHAPWGWWVVGAC